MSACCSPAKLRRRYGSGRGTGRRLSDPLIRRYHFFVKAIALFALLCAPALADIASCVGAVGHDNAFKECSPVAEQGNAWAQSILGAMYDSGQGVAQDYKEAMRLYRLAANQGNALAQYNLAVMYDVGKGVPHDYTEAVKWYRLAADQGNAQAQYNLGVLYDQGQGVPQDYKSCTIVPVGGRSRSGRGAK